MSQPFVSLITPTLDGRHHLELFLASVDAQAYPRELFEVIVVDNGSTDGTDEFLRTRWPDVRVVRNRDNAGFARANNQGAEVARGRYLALLNNDLRLDRAWLETMVDCAQMSSGKPACVASPILNWDGSAIDFVDAAMSFNGIGFQPHAGAPFHSEGRDDLPSELLFACGAAMLIDRHVYLEAGGFDEDYFAYYEDVDLGWRLWLMGHRVELCPSAVAYHRRNASQGPRHRTVHLLERNALRSVIKNYDDRSLEVVLPAALLLALGRVAERAKPRTGSPGRTGVRRWLRRGRTTLALEALATISGIGDVVDDLPRLLEKRRWVQARRRRADAEIIHLFRTPFRLGGRDEALVRELGVVDYFEALSADAGGALGQSPAAASPARAR
jgi:GT2 family glycosyltransferase